MPRSLKSNFDRNWQRVYKTKGHSLYQISSKMLPGSKVITLVEKKRKEVAWLGLELTTSHLEVQCANHYTMETFMMNLYFFKCHDIKVITFEPGNIFELVWYSEWPLPVSVASTVNYSAYS